MVDRLAIGVIDNLDEEEFARAFSRSEASIVTEIKDAIKEQKRH